MNRKLILLNSLLALVLIFGGVQLRNEYLASKERAASIRKGKLQPAATPPFTPLAGDPAVMATGYNYIAQKFLFHPSRSSEVVHDPPPPPPPPPPMPDLPRYHGQMNLGEGPTVILVEHPGMPEKDLKSGDTIGQFKLLDVNTNDITFQWTFNGETVRRSLRELSDRGGQGAAAPDARPAAAAAAGVAAPPPPPPAPVQTTSGIQGDLTPQGLKTCVANDATPDGTVVNGFRKNSIATPFGKACVWEPVK